MTLIPIEKLVEFSKLQREGEPAPLVLMVAGPCGLCGRLKDDALMPLLTNSQLQVFNHLILDKGTAIALLKRKANESS